MSPAVAVPSTCPRRASVACATGFTVAMACIQPGIVSIGANALETNISGIITIIPANWTTSWSRSRSPISPNSALIAPASTTSTTTAATASTCGAVELETQSHGGDPEQRSPGERKHGLVDGASHPRQRRSHRQGREAVVQAVGVIDRGGDSGVGAGHHRGDGEHRRGEEDDVADPGRKSRSCGDAAEHLTEQHQHRHRQIPGTWGAWCVGARTNRRRSVPLPRPYTRGRGRFLDTEQWFPADAIRRR